MQCQQLVRSEWRKEELRGENELNAGMTGNPGLGTAACL